MIELLYHTAKSFLGIFAYGKILAAGRSVALGLKKIWIDDLGATVPHTKKMYLLRAKTFVNEYIVEGLTLLTRKCSENK